MKNLAKNHDFVFSYFNFQFYQLYCYSQILSLVLIPLLQINASFITLKDYQVFKFEIGNYEKKKAKTNNNTYLI